jgi:hypothetical protein
MVMSYNGAAKFLPDNQSLMEITQIIIDGANCHPWRKVYVWWPVKTINGERVWGERVFKRKVWVVWGTGFHMEPHVQYATVFDLITYDDTSTNP